MKNNREKGKFAEEIACIYLKNKGYSVMDRNYQKRYGEIDIIALKDGILNFIEVKSTINGREIGNYRPEENVHDLKIRRLRKTIQCYLNENKYGLEMQFRFHVLTVRIGKGNNKVFVKMFHDIIL